MFSDVGKPRTYPCFILSKNGKRKIKLWLWKAFKKDNALLVFVFMHWHAQWVNHAFYKKVVATMGVQSHTRFPCSGTQTLQGSCNNQETCLHSCCGTSPFIRCNKEEKLTSANLSMCNYWVLLWDVVYPKPTSNLKSTLCTTITLIWGLKGLIWYIVLVLNYKCMYYKYEMALFGLDFEPDMIMF